jgi:phytoene dehydrogenase-like protein
MAQRYDAIVVGGGHNGLVAAAYLARAGRKVVVLERRELLGGAAASEEVWPGYKVSTCAQVCGLLRARIVRELKLAEHGLAVTPCDPAILALGAGGRHLTLWRAAERSAAAISRFSKKDAEAYPRFGQALGRLAGFLNHLVELEPPRVPTPRAGDLPGLLRLGLRFRRLTREQQFEILRVLPMPIQDFLGEWFETDLLQAALGAGGVIGNFVGPRSPGTVFSLASGALASAGGAFGGWGQVRGGMGGLAAALAAAARQHNAEIRTAAEVAQILVKDGAVSGVALANGEEIAAKTVLSNADPKRTFLGLIDPVHLEPGFLQKVRNIKMRGVGAKVHLALGELPRIQGLEDSGTAALRGMIQVAPSLDYLERAFDDAKYGRISARPLLVAVIPSLTDPSVAPAGKHLMSIYVQYTPYQLRDGDWNRRREELGDLVIDTLSEYAPNLKGAILERQVLTPLDLEQMFGLTGAESSHGEQTLDQLLVMRPVPGWARYRTPIRGLYLCGAGTHPGGGVMGACGHNAARAALKDNR